MVYYSDGTTAGISFAVFISSCIMYLVCSCFVLMYIGDKAHAWHWDHVFRYSISCIICGSCIGIIGLIIFLVFVYESKDINNSLLSFIYCLVFLIIPCLGLLIITAVAATTYDWKKHNELKFELSAERSIRKQLRTEKRQKHDEFTILFMGNDIQSTQLFFDNLRIYHDSDSYTENKMKFYKHLILKYIVKNFQSLIIITMQSAKIKKENTAFSTILATPTYGIHPDGKRLNDPNIIDNIMSVWEDDNVQNVIQKLQSQKQTDTMDVNEDENEQKYLIDTMHDITNEYNIVHTQFINHFLNNKNIKRLLSKDVKLNDDDIDILLKEHEYYQNKLYFGNDEYRIVQQKYQTILDIKLHESQSREYEKWIDIFEPSVLENISILYVVDLSMFKCGNSEFMTILRFWSYECFNDCNYIPITIETMINFYVGNDDLMNDLDRFKKIMINYDYPSFTLILLFVNCHIFHKYFQKYDIDGLKVFFPQDIELYHDVLESIKNDANKALEEIKRLYSQNAENTVPCLEMNELDDIHSISNVFSDIYTIIINQSLAYSGLI